MLLSSLPAAAADGAAAAAAAAIWGTAALAPTPRAYRPQPVGALPVGGCAGRLAEALARAATSLLPFAQTR